MNVSLTDRCPTKPRPYEPESPQDLWAALFALGQLEDEIVRLQDRRDETDAALAEVRRKANPLRRAAESALRREDPAAAVRGAGDCTLWYLGSHGQLVRARVISGFGVPLDGSGASAQPPTNAEIDEAAGHAAMLDVDFGAMGTPEAHVYDPRRPGGNGAEDDVLTLAARASGAVVAFASGDDEEETGAAAFQEPTGPRPPAPVPCEEFFPDTGRSMVPLRPA